jgi:hypothetical protein
VNIEEIATALDAEIARLQQARDAIAGFSANGRRPASSAFQAKRRSLSAAAREKIAAAQRKRWAKQKLVSATAKRVG